MNESSKGANMEKFYKFSQVLSTQEYLKAKRKPVQKADREVEQDHSDMACH